MIRQTQWQKAANASLTVFLSLSLTIILSLFFTLIYGTRISAIRMQTQLIMDTAQNSCLGEYSRELLSQYDFFFIDTAYGMSRPSQEYVRRHLETYVQENCRSGEASLGRIKSLAALTPLAVSVDEARYACDQNFAAVLEQITAYMSADPAGNALSRIVNLTGDYENAGLDLDAWQKEKDQVEEDMEKAREEAAEEAEEEPEDENPTEDLDDFRSEPILQQVFGDGTSVSGKTTTVSALFSHRTPHYGDGIKAANSHNYSRASAAMVNLYLSEKCSSFGSGKENRVLDYEREYILFGESSDKKNLEALLERLCAIRTAANCVYLFSSGTRRNEAKALAATIGAATATPALVPVYTTAILLAWGYLESICDLKTLTDGGKVPLLKDDSTWETGVKQILQPSQVKGKDRGKGMDYDDYLGILLYLKNMDDKCSRLMDVCEMNLRRTPGNAGFCMDWCMDTFTATIELSGRIGYSCSMTRTITYN